MRTRLSRIIGLALGGAMAAGLVVGFAGEAEAQSREDVLVVRQPDGGEMAAKDCYWFNGKLYCIYYGFTG